MRIFELVQNIECPSTDTLDSDVVRVPTTAPLGSYNSHFKFGISAGGVANERQASEHIIPTRVTVPEREARGTCAT